MKILALSALSDAPEYRKDNRTSPVDQWRIVRPYMALKKYAGWDIDFDRVVIPNFNKGMEITDDTFTEVYNRLKNYDMVVSSYFSSASMFSLIHVTCKKLGIPFVMDIDDDWFNIPLDNPVWNKITKTEWVNIMVMLEEVDFVTTTNEYLAAKIAEHRYNKPPHTVLVLPNLISTEEYEHSEVDNGDKVVIGWMGGASHYRDIHETGVLEALQKIMNEHKNVEVHLCGMVLDKYLPKKRTKLIEPRKGMAWLELYKELNFDIGLAPLLGREFDKSKSNIKWQEYALMGACFVGTAVGPYMATVKDGFNGYLVKNDSESWYKKLKKLVVDAETRKMVAATAKAEVIRDWSVENNWQKLAQRIEMIPQLVTEAKE